MNELFRRWSPLFEEDGATGSGEPEPQPAKAEAKYTDADVDAIVNKKFAKWQEKQAEEIAKAVEEAQKLAEMNAQEKAEHQRDELQKQLDTLMREKAVADMKASARGMLQAENVTNIPDELVAVLIADDAETTAEAVKAFVTMYNTAVQNGIKDALKGETPKRGSSQATLTKEEIMAIKDPVERQAKIAENIELFQGYFNK